MPARAVDATVAQALLEAVSPQSLPVAMRVLEQVEQELAAQRRQRELQLEQAGHQARPGPPEKESVGPRDPPGAAGPGGRGGREHRARGATVARLPADRARL